MEKGKVLQDWMGRLSWKQQSVIISSLRGADTGYCPQIKKINKWMRGITQNNADISSQYMQEEKLPILENIEKEFEFCSVHYAIHFLQGLEIIGYNHPNDEISNMAKNYYYNLVEKVLHLNPETKEQLEERLEDKNFNKTNL